MIYFDWKYYIDKYIDLRQAGINTMELALTHWKNHGINENRICNKIFEKFNAKEYMKLNGLKGSNGYNNSLLYYYHKINPLNKSIQVSPFILFLRKLLNSIYVSKTLIKELNITDNLNKSLLQLNKSLTIINTPIINSNILTLSKMKYTNDNMVKIVICTCVYKRYKLAKFCIKQWLKCNVYKIIVVYSFDEDYNNLKDIVDSRLVLLKYTNLPLSNKWNHSVISAKRYNPDCVMIMGSDDVFFESYITKVKYNINRGVEYISNTKWVNCWYFNNNIIVSAEKYIKRATNDGLGSGRVISASVLNNIDWNLYLFDKPINKCLDGTSFTKINKFIKNSVFDIDNYSIILLKVANDNTAITVKSDLVEYIKTVYRTSNFIKTMDYVNIINYK
jgi:hypothetical protein